MKITLISPYPDVTAFGVRTISAYLRKFNYKTQLIFLPDPHYDDPVYGRESYEDKVLDALLPLCRDSDIIGITLMTNFFEGAVQITRKLKSGLKAPVIWGGIHPTIRQEESLQYADIVCIGDGEDAVLDLMSMMEKGEPYLNIKNLWFKNNGSLIMNRARDLSHNIDVYPMPDYSLEDHHILHNDKIQPMTYDLLKHYLENGTVSRYLKKIGYQTMTGRGCPHKCTYCVNDTLKEMYGNMHYLRWRSTKHTISEFQWIKEKMPYIDFLWISDDAFFARNKKRLKEFCQEYKEKINLPFTCLGSPATISEEKMEMLVDAGLIYLQMGVESGSPRIQKIFNRSEMNNDRLKRAFRIINRYKDRMYPPSYDFILDVPYETDEDKIESLKLIVEIPKPFNLQPFSLVLYPGTKLYDMAKEDGFIENEKGQIYTKSYTMREPNYLNLLFALAQGSKFPGTLLKFLVSSPTVDILNSKPFKPFFKLLYNGLKSTYGLARKLMGRAR